MEFGSGYDAQLRLGFAIVLVEQFVGEIVRAAEEEVGVEGAEFAEIDTPVGCLEEILIYMHTEGSLQLCDVRIRCNLDYLEEA